jgi:hypothetical protein
MTIKSTTNEATKRVQALRQRRKALGLVRVDFYLTPDHIEKVKAFIKKITDKDKKQSIENRG